VSDVDALPIFNVGITHTSGKMARTGRGNAPKLKNASQTNASEISDLKGDKASQQQKTRGNTVRDGRHNTLDQN
jgi:hypothetical protein